MNDPGFDDRCPGSNVYPKFGGCRTHCTFLSGGNHHREIRADDAGVDRAERVVCQSLALSIDVAANDERSNSRVSGHNDRILLQHCQRSGGGLPTEVGIEFRNSPAR